MDAQMTAALSGLMELQQLGADSSIADGCIRYNANFHGSDADFNLLAVPSLHSFSSFTSSAHPVACKSSFCCWKLEISQVRPAARKRVDVKLLDGQWTEL